MSFINELEQSIGGDQYNREPEEEAGIGDFVSGDFFKNIEEYNPEDDTEYNVVGAAKSAFYRGARAWGGNLPSMAGIIIPGRDPLEKIGEENKAYYDQKMDESEDVSEFNRSVAGGRESIWTEALGSAGETAAAIIPSALLGPVGSAMASGMFLDLNKEEAYDMAISKGVDEDTAQLTSWVAGIVNSALDMYGIRKGPLSALVGKPAKNISNFILGVARSALYEGGTEGLQEFVTELSSEVGARREGESEEGYFSRVYSRMPETWERIKKAAQIGGIMGGGFHSVGGVRQLAAPFAEPKWEMLNSLEADGTVTPEVLDEMIASEWGADQGIGRSDLDEVKKRKIRKANKVGAESIKATAISDREIADIKDFEDSLEAEESYRDNTQEFLMSVQEEGEAAEPERATTREEMWKNAGISLEGVTQDPVIEQTVEEAGITLPRPSEASLEADLAREVDIEYEEQRKKEALAKADEVEKKFDDRKVEPEVESSGIISKATQTLRRGKALPEKERKPMGKASPAEEKARQKLVWEQNKVPGIELNEQMVEDIKSRGMKDVKKVELEKFAKDIGVRKSGTKDVIFKRIESEIKKERTRNAKRIQSALQSVSDAIGQREAVSEKVSKEVEQPTPSKPSGEKTQVAPSEAPKVAGEKVPAIPAYAGRFAHRKDKVSTPSKSKVTKLAVEKADFTPKTRYLRYDGTMDMGTKDFPVEIEQWTLIGLPKKQMTAKGAKQAVMDKGTYVNRGTLKSFGFTDAQMEEVKGISDKFEYAKRLKDEKVTVKAKRESTGEVVEVTQVANEVMAELNSKVDILKEVIGCLK